MLEDAPGGASKGFWGAVTSALDLDFSDIDESVAALVRPPAEGELQIVLNCSTVELKGVEAYAVSRPLLLCSGIIPFELGSCGSKVLPCGWRHTR